MKRGAPLRTLTRSGGRLVLLAAAAALTAGLVAGCGPGNSSPAGNTTTSHPSSTSNDDGY